MPDTRDDKGDHDRTDTYPHRTSSSAETHPPDPLGPPDSPDSPDSPHSSGGLPRGTLLGARYRIEKMLGKGGMGRVYAALDERLGRRVAVKVLSSRVGDETAALLARESKILAGLQHPGIVALHEAVSEAEWSYLVMDLVDGVALGHALEKVRDALAVDGDPLARPRSGAVLERAIDRPLPPGRESLITTGDWFRTVARVALEIARTIEAAHESGVVHRDLKPQNVMLTGGGSPVVLDFGLGGRSDGDAGTITRSLVGTVAYLAPEQIETERVGADPRTDVYQLGLILYEMLTLQRAFAGDTMGEILVRIQRGLFPRPRSLDARVPRDLEAICLKACEFKPADRYATAREMREDLGRFLDGHAVSCGDRWSRTQASMRRAKRTLAAHPMITGGILVAATAVIVASTANFGSAAEITAFRMDVNGKVKPFGFEDAVEPGDYLGVDIRTQKTQFVYAFSIFRSTDPVDQVRRYVPMKPALLEDVAAAKGASMPDPPEFGLEVPACAGKDACPKVFCTKIGNEGPNNAMEGLLVFSSLVRRPDFETWLVNVDERGHAEGLPEDQTFELLHHPPLDRGRPMRGIKVEDRDRRFAPILAEGSRKRTVTTIDETTKSLYVEGRVVVKK